MPKVRRSTLIEAAIETLASSGRPMTLDQITRAVLRVETNGAKIGARVLAPLLATGRTANVQLHVTRASTWTCLEIRYPLHRYNE